MNRFEILLSESELKIILEAMTSMEEKMSEICKTSNSDDEIADIGNDLIELRLLLKPLREKAIEQFGKNITNFSRKPL